MPEIKYIRQILARRPEDIFILYIPFVGTAVLGIYGYATGWFVIESAEALQDLVVSYMRAGGLVFFMTFIASVVVGSAVGFSLLLGRIAVAFLERDAVPLRAFLAKSAQGARRLGYILLRLFVSALFVSAIVSLLALRASDGRISAVSTFLLEADHWFFGVLPPFWFQESGSIVKQWFDAFGVIFIHAYQFLEVAIGATLFLFLLFDKRRMQVFLLSFFLGVFLAFPIWYALPALSPYDAFLDPLWVFPEVGVHAQEAITRYEPNGTLLATLDRIRYTSDLPAVTTMPSMHVAWATIIAVALFGFYPRLGALAWIWWACNNIGAVYLLQHYAVDIPAGWIIGALAICIAERIIPKKKKLPGARERTRIFSIPTLFSS